MIIAPSVFSYQVRTHLASEIAVIEQMFAPAMDAAVKIFEEWRIARGVDANGNIP